MYFSTYFYHVVSECKWRAESCDLCHFGSILYRAVESDLHCCTLLPRHIICGRYGTPNKNSVCIANVATQATTTSSGFKSFQNITFNQNKVCIVVFKINRIYENVDI